MLLNNSIKYVRLFLSTSGVSSYNWLRTTQGLQDFPYFFWVLDNITWDA